MSNDIITGKRRRINEELRLNCAYCMGNCVRLLKSRIRVAMRNPKRFHGSCTSDAYVMARCPDRILRRVGAGRKIKDLRKSVRRDTFPISYNRDGSNRNRGNALELYRIIPDFEATIYLIITTALLRDWYFIIFLNLYVSGSITFWRK